MESNDHAQEEVQFTLNVTNISMSGLEMDDLYRASSLTVHKVPDSASTTTINTTTTAAAASSTSTESEQRVLSADGTKAFCQNCHRFVTEWSFERHRVNCTKQFYFCAPCNKVMKVAEREQHDNSLHSALQCAKCGETIAGGKKTLISHQKHECLQRPIMCTYCRLPFAFIVHEDHQIACGSRTELCLQCNQYIAISLIDQHTADVHGFAVHLIYSLISSVCFLEK